MSTYAVLGATGQVGGSILHLLSANPKTKANVLVRSRAKLEKTHPLISSSPNIHVFEASISDPETLTSCLRNTHAIFLTVAVTENKPGVNISLTTAKAVISALETLKKETENFRPPRLIILSSASLDPKFWSTVPHFVHNLMYAANIYIYDDLVRAEEYLRRHADWLDMVFVMPGGLSHDVQQGHEVSAERQQTFISFLDLAAGMVEVADSAGEWEGGHVSVVLKGGRKARVEWWAPVLLSKGLVGWACPWLYGWVF